MVSHIKGRAMCEDSIYSTESSERHFPNLHHICVIKSHW